MLRVAHWEKNFEKFLSEKKNQNFNYSAVAYKDYICLDSNMLQHWNLWFCSEKHGQSPA